MCRSSVKTPACRTDTPAREAHARLGRAFAGHTGTSTERSARLACEFSPSRRLQCLLWLLAAQSLLLFAFSRLPWIAVGVASFLVFAIVWLEWRRLEQSVGRLSTAEKRWYWQVQGGAKREFRFCGELTLWRWLIVINGRDLEGRRLRLVLSSDATAADDWRRLLVALRFSR